MKMKILKNQIVYGGLIKIMQYYYFNAIEKVTVGILALFNDIYISQYKYNNTTGNWVKSYYRVPVEIGSKDKILREYENISLSNSPKRYPNVPRFSLMLNNIEKYNDKQTNQMNIIKNQYTSTDNGKKIMTYVRNPAWWKANYTLFILTKRMDDMTQIMEQICPVFQPQRSLNIKLIPELDISISLETTISNSITFELPQELDSETIRFVNSSIDIQVPVPMFPPITDAKVISSIITRFAAVNTFDINMSDILDSEEFKLYGDRNLSTSIKLTTGNKESWVFTRDGKTSKIKLSSLIVSDIN